MPTETCEVLLRVMALAPLLFALLPEVQNRCPWACISANDLQKAFVVKFGGRPRCSVASELALTRKRGAVLGSPSKLQELTDVFAKNSRSFCSPRDLDH